MSENRIFFPAGGLRIEGLFEDIAREKGVVISHPHPLYGGDMYNNVVEAVRGAYREKGYSTLRFNFRGVGQSGGTHDRGVGEQEDVRGALAYLSEAGKTQIDLVGYSFGAWVNALGIERFEKADRLIMVSPPVNAMDFSFLASNPKVRLVIVGTEDHVADSRAIAEMIRIWDPKASLKVIHKADHFYLGKEDELVAILHDFLSDE